MSIWLAGLISTIIVFVGFAYKAGREAGIRRERFNWRVHVSSRSFKVKLADGPHAGTEVLVVDGLTRELHMPVVDDTAPLAWLAESDSMVEPMPSGFTLAHYRMDHAVFTLKKGSAE